MLRYRTFCNGDPPTLTELWRSRAGQRGLTDSVSPDLFEQLVFAKPYFDYAGLILAHQDDRPVGFAHAGFGPNEQRNGISTTVGVTCLVLVRPDCAEAEVASGLLQQCEAYLGRRGAKVLHGGAIRPLNSFYLGLYGGSELPGILESDTVARELFDSHGYRRVDCTSIFRRKLTGFEVAMDRLQMQIRRQMVVEVTQDAATRDWWEACTIGDFDLTRFELVPRTGGAAVASVTFRSMEPSGTVATGRAAGLIGLHVDESFRHRGLSVFLLSEAFRQFLRQGIGLVEAQASQHDIANLEMLKKLGFEQVGRGIAFQKTINTPAT